MSDEQERWSVLSVIEFHDSDEMSFQVLGHDLSKDDAEKLMKLVPAIAYSGEGRVKQGRLHMVRSALVDEMKAHWVSHD